METLEYLWKRFEIASMKFNNFHGLYTPSKYLQRPLTQTLTCLIKDNWHLSYIKLIYSRVDIL